MKRIAFATCVLLALLLRVSIFKECSSYVPESVTPRIPFTKKMKQHHKGLMTYPSEDSGIVATSDLIES
ncbi:MAG: hypothetical protein HRT74_13900, partial [Flavobacteriales bacterium]|nr:hypothetical protein [Flavobacteriales bacterium]